MKKYLILLLIFALSACASLRSRFHTVRPGQTLAQIAQKYKVPLSALYDRNPDVKPKKLRAGSRLYIPFESGNQWNQDRKLVFKRSVASKRFVWPVRGRISSYFGRRWNRRHEGIDIVAGKGTPIRASRSGEVVYSGNGIKGYGNLVILRHIDGYSTVYAHLHRIHARKGQYIHRGKRLGTVGKTGRATNYHLHFEIRNQRSPVNPLLYLQTQYAKNTLSP